MKIGVSSLDGVASCCVVWTRDGNSSVPYCKADFEGDVEMRKGRRKT